MNKNKKYRGILAAPLPRGYRSRPFGLLRSEKQQRAIKARQSREYAEKIAALYQHFNIPVGSVNLLVVKLAEELGIPAFREEQRSGAKSKWNDHTKAVLVVEVERRMRNDEAHSPAWVAKRLAEQEPWKSFLQARERGGASSNAAEALRRMYFKARATKWAKLYSDAFKYHEHRNTIPEWEAGVIDIVKNPAPG